MFEFATPWAFLALIFPLLVWFFCPRAPIHLSMALKVPFFDDLSQLVKQQKFSFQKNTPWIILYISWCFLVIALAGPRWVGQPRPLAHEGYNIMLALDISPSMGINDMITGSHRNTRLDVVKRAGRQFVEDRVGDNIGLILFGEQAYLFTPLTYDHQTVLQRLDDASVGLAGKSTSLGDALGLAIKRLQQVPKEGRMVILLTDGVSNSGVLSPIKAAELAQRAGIVVHTIGLHSDIDPRSFSGLFLNSNGAADLDEKTLKKIARLTGGRYFRASNLESLQEIYHAIDHMTRVSQDKAYIRPQHEYSHWFLATGLGLLMLVIARESGLFLSLKRQTEADYHA